MCDLSIKWCPQTASSTGKQRQEEDRGWFSSSSISLSFSNFCCFFDFTLMLKDMFCTPHLTQTHVHTTTNTHCTNFALQHSVMLAYHPHFNNTFFMPLVKMSCFPVWELQPPTCCRFPAPAWITHSGGSPVAKQNQAQQLNAESLKIPALSCPSTYTVSRWRVWQKKNEGQWNISYATPTCSL